MKRIVLMVIFALFGAVGCSKKEAVLDEKVHLKIVVKADGTIFADGAQSDLADLSRRLDVLKEKKGVVWYHRANPGGEPHPQAMATIKLVADKQLPIAMFLKEDFSERMPFK